MEDGQSVHAMTISNGRWKSIGTMVPTSQAVQIGSNGRTMVWEGRDRYPYEGRGAGGGAGRRKVAGRDAKTLASPI